MHPPSVQKHTRHQRLHALAGLDGLRHGAPVVDEFLARLGAETGLVDEDQNVQGNKAPGKVRPVAAVDLVVAEGKEHQGRFIWSPVGSGGSRSPGWPPRRPADRGSGSGWPGRAPRG